MTCNLERPTAQALFDRYKNLFSATVMGGAAIVPESNEWYVVAVNYAIAEEFYAITNQSWKERDPRQACCENLIKMAATEGIYPRPAVYAQGYVTLSGTANSELPSPLDFTIDGQSFTTAATDSQPLSLDSTGAATIRVRALSAGEVGNTTATTGYLNTGVTGVDRSVVVCGGTFCNGSEAEGCEAFRARYLRRLQYNPRATSTWITDKLLEWPCATRAMIRAGNCCSCTGATNCTDCGCSDCGGKMEYYLMFDNSFANGIAPASVVEEAETWLFGSPQGYGLGQVEIGICGRIHAVTGVPVDVYVSMEDCVSAAQRTLIESHITEYFSTLEPSKPAKQSAIYAIVSSVVGSDTDTEVTITLTNEADGYGTVDNPGTDGKVFAGGCELEPDCDYLLYPNSITVTGSTTTSGGCP